MPRMPHGAKVSPYDGPSEPGAQSQAVSNKNQLSTNIQNKMNYPLLLIELRHHKASRYLSAGERNTDLKSIAQKMSSEKYKTRKAKQMHTTSGHLA